MGIVVIGATFVDIKGYPDQNFHPHGRNAGSIEQVYGGVCRNIVYDLAQVDLNPTFLSVLDDSPVSDDIVSDLKQVHVETKYIQKTDTGLGKWLAVFDEHGEVYASVSKRPNLNALVEVLEQKGDEIFGPCDAIAIEIDQEENILEHVFALAKRHHKPVYAVVSNMSIALLRKKWIQQCACLVCNLEEAQQLFDIVLDEQSVERCIEQLLEQSLKQKIVPLVVTMGSRGAIYIESQEYFGHICAKEVQVVDTTGCGDAFFAGVVMGVTYGQTLAQACQIGTTLASSVIQTKENVCFHVSSEQLGLQLKTK